MSANYYAIIMAGGGGTRLWPLSRRRKPKQLLRLFDEKSLFQIAVERLLPIMPPEQVFVVTIEAQAQLLQPQSPSLPVENFIIEPAPRGTASVIGLAAIILHRQDPDCVMAALTADHYISHVDRFQELLLAAYELASEGDLVTLGISPSYPETGYGYIQRGELRGRYRDYEAFRVLAFKEKPSLEQAQAYLSSGRYAWNSGMFVWKVSRILEEIERQMPSLYVGLQQIDAALGSPEERRVLADVWEGLESQTIDYGVMEGAERVSVIPADDLGWWDVGGWGRFFEFIESDESGNLLEAPRTLVIDTARTLIYQAPEVAEDRLIATLGVEDLVIVDAGDVLLVCKRDQAERVRHLVEMLNKSDLQEYL